MEPLTSAANNHLNVPLSIPTFVPPTLKDSEHYHVFLSYSSTDYQWTHSLIHRLESCGLQICYHERDFLPGRTVLDNMSECIQESQKVLLVLSSEFVRSRWCLLEANMSLFRDCLERKPIVPVLLESGVSVPLHLCHLTYLEAEDPDFMYKLLKVLCTPNQQLRGSAVVPYQPPSIYNGKTLQPLIAANDEGLFKWDCGVFSDMEVPDQLRLIIKDQDTYKKALRIINSVAQEKVWLRSLWVRVGVYITTLILIAFFLTVAIVIIGFSMGPDDWCFQSHYFTFCPVHEISSIFFAFFTAPLGLLVQLCLWKKDDEKYIVRELQKALGQANAVLFEETVLMGCRSNSKIYLVYVSLDSCRREFAQTFSEQACAEDMFHRALLFFSPGYACCLAKRHFPFPYPSSPGHLQGGVCFCQYVSEQLRAEKWE